MTYYYYREIFPKLHTFLAVIHVEGVAQMFENLAIARENGADGAFLINHHDPPGFLRRAYISARQVHPDWWIGLNLLGLSADEAIRTVPADASGLWTDNAGITAESEDPPQFANHAWELRRNRIDWGGLYFGGVAFKYQQQIGDFAALGLAARAAAPLMDVVTTSGDGTGIAPPLTKIVAMRQGIGDAPLAIASGITPENVGEYLGLVDERLGLVDCFLVATGVSRHFTELDPERVRALADKIHAS